MAKGDFELAKAINDAQVALGTSELKQRLRFYPEKDDLPSHLHVYVDDEVQGITPLRWFRHPLLVQWFPLATPIDIDEFLTKKRAMADSYLAKGDVVSYLHFFERGYRMDELLDLVGNNYFDFTKRRDCVRYWRAAREYWIDAEHDESDPIWTELIDQNIPHRWAMTLSADRRAMRAMPDMVTAFKGFNTNATDHDTLMEMGQAGWSWSLSHKTAVFFANRFMSNANTPKIAVCQIPKSLIVAYLTSRGESEIVVHPEDIFGLDLRITGAPRHRNARAGY